MGDSGKLWGKTGACPPGRPACTCRYRLARVRRAAPPRKIRPLVRRKIYIFFTEKTSVCLSSAESVFVFSRINTCRATRSARISGSLGEMFLPFAAKCVPGNLIKTVGVDENLWFFWPTFFSFFFCLFIRFIYEIKVGLEKFFPRLFATRERGILFVVFRIWMRNGLFFGGEWKFWKIYRASRKAAGCFQILNIGRCFCF